MSSALNPTPVHGLSKDAKAYCDHLTDYNLSRAKTALYELGMIDIPLQDISKNMKTQYDGPPGYSVPDDIMKRYTQNKIAKQESESYLENPQNKIVCDYILYIEGVKDLTKKELCDLLIKAQEFKSNLEILKDVEKLQKIHTLKKKQIQLAKELKDLQKSNNNYER